MSRDPEGPIASPSIARSTAQMSVSTTISRVTGFVRNWAMAYALGVTILSSSYVVAKNIPNMVYELVIGGVLSSVFIPIFIERMQRHGEEDAWRLASNVFNLAMVVLGVVAIGGTVFAEQFVRTQTFRISVEEARMATYFFRFFAVQIVFYGWCAIFKGVLESYRRFLAPAIAPIFNNVVVIVSLLGFYVPLRDSDPDLAIAGLAVGASLGVLVMAAFHVPSLAKLGIRYTWGFGLDNPALRKMGRKMIPIFVYVATNMVALSFRNAYAFEVSDKGPAALQYAWMWYQLPYGIFAVALATAVFPELSTDASANDWESFKQHFSRGLRATGVIIIPISAVMIALATPLTTLYRAGDFRPEDVPIVAAVLVWWAAGLFSFAAYMFLLRTFYSIQDTRTPMLTNFGGAGLRILGYATLTGIGASVVDRLPGIPLADAISYSVHFLALWWILRRKIGGFGSRATLWSLARVTVASIAGAFAAYGLVLLTAGLADVRLGFLVQLVVAGLGGLGVAYGLAAAMRVPEMSFAASLARRLLGRFGPGSDR